MPRRNKQGNRNIRAMSGPSPQATRYNGPVKVHNNRADTVLITIAAPNQVSISTDATGSGTVALTVNSSDVLASGDFLSMANLYEEYRVLAVRAEFYPKLRYADGSAVGGGTGSEAISPIILSPWREDATADTTLNQAMVRGGAKSVAVNDYVTHEVKADEVDQMEWTDVATSIPAGQTYGIHSFLTTNGGPASAVVQYGHLFAFYTVQFRTRRFTGTLQGVGVRPSEMKQGEGAVANQQARPVVSSIDDASRLVHSAVRIINEIRDRDSVLFTGNSRIPSRPPDQAGQAVPLR